MSLRTTLNQWARPPALAAGLILALGAQAAGLQTYSEQSMADYTSNPITSVNSATPLVMLTLSRDHQLFYKAYNDYSDLDGDGAPETTYKHSVDYYGYFDSYKCYNYDTGDDRFEPASTNTDKYCNGQWSGNFLNWASTTRMDAVRKLLYGGKRVVDNANTTVLERASLPTDAHSFAKYYAGSDLDKLTPFAAVATPAFGPVSGDLDYFTNKRGISGISRSGNTATVTTSDDHGFENGQWVEISDGNRSEYRGRYQIFDVSARRFSYSTGLWRNPSGNYQIRALIYAELTDQTPMAIGDQLLLQNSEGTQISSVVDSQTIHNGSNFVDAVGDDKVFIYLNGSSIVTQNGNGIAKDMRLIHASAGGISFCNLTPSANNNTDRYSHTNREEPLMRVARGNFELWGANEKRQCQWFGGNDSYSATYSDQQSGFGGGLRSNGNRAALSGLNAASENPRQNLHGLGSGTGHGSTSADGQFVMRVQACVTGLIGRESCKAYPDVARGTASPKPIGLLQVYGDERRIKFGLVTPSYQKNVSGGVVRKNLGPPGDDVGMSDEVRVETNGTFTGANGIIQNLDSLRVYGYRYDVNDNYGSGNGCSYQRTGIAPGNTGGGNVVNESNCASWGNPISEAYTETLRYLAGKSPDNRFRYSNGHDATLGLSLVSNWVDPLDERNYCSSLNVITFNASVSSYDADQATLADLPGSPDVAKITGVVGDLEKLTGKNFFIGQTAADQNQLCTAKQVNDLGAVAGICPEAGPLRGSYLMAGAAYHAKTQRIRSDLDAALPAGDESSLKVDTYAIQLATNTPKILVRDPDTPSKILATLLPLYRLDLGNAGYGGGAIVDFRIVDQDVANGRGRFYINWEDSSQGGDYDQDVWGTITYQLSADKKTLAITTDTVSASTNNPQGFGYIVSGTTQDGPHFHSGIYDFDFTDPTKVTVRTGGAGGSVVNGNNNIGGGGGINDSGGCRDCELLDPATTVVYTLGSTAAELLQDPLYYAAKYGGFDDANGDGTPDLQAEWDSRNADGTVGSDGLPDNYFFVSNPSALEGALQAAFSAILAKVSSGTAAAVVANAREGTGAVYQALYEPSRTDNRGREVKWIGTLHGLFVDEDGLLREDGNGDKRLSPDYAVDPPIELFFDNGDRVTKIRRYNGDPDVVTPEIDRLDNLGTLWNAREQLSKVSNVTTQRNYSSAAGTGRHIKTWLDRNLNGRVDNGEVVDFTASTFTSNPASGNFGILNTRTLAEARRLVNYVRGDEDADLRNRTLNYDNDAANISEVQRLGDIVQSTPTVVGTPAEAFDLLYDDETYAVYRDRYRNRRNVVYVGSNGGLLHAFNAGFYDPSTKRFSESPLGGATGTAHPLGSELWAYAPFNLLPHLPWMADPDYTHVWYVDGKPRAFDARIFSPDAEHPYGWGTVLVVGMRFGGKPITLRSEALVTASNPDGDDDAWSAFGTPASFTARSAFLVFDVTNPEAAPRLIAEITDANLGLTTSYPTVVAVSEKGISIPRNGSGGITNNGAGAFNPGDKWYLAFGSGPRDLEGAPPSAAGRLYMYDLGARQFLGGWAPKTIPGAGNSFVGDPVTVDWDLDFKADALYFGTIGGSVANPDGGLYKVDFNESDADRLPAGWIGPGLLTDPGKPVVSTPSVTFGDRNERWVLAGTGRLFANTEADKGSTPRQALFGIVDDPDTTLPTNGIDEQVDYADLVNVTDAVVTLSGNVSGTDPAVDTEAELVQEALDQSGWRLDLDVSITAERSLSQFSVLGNVLFASVFTPSNDVCGGEGESRLFGLSYKTGTPPSGIPVFGTQQGSFDGEPADIIRSSVALGAGQAASPSLHVGGARDQRGLTIFTQTSVGSIEVREGQASSSLRSGEVDWREPRE